MNSDNKKQLVSSAKRNAPPGSKKPGGAPSTGRQPLANAGAAKGGASTPFGAADEVHLRADYYKNGYHSAWMVAKIAVVYSLIVTIILGFLIIKPPFMAFFATTQDGKTLQLIPLSKPNHADTVVTSWVEHALVDTFNYNFSDYKQRLSNSIQRYFTDAGGDKLVTALTKGNIISEITEKEYFASLVIKDHPVISNKGGAGDVFAWKIEAPAVITYRNKKTVNSQNVIVSVVVVRRSELIEPAGLGISQIIISRPS